MKKVLSQIFLAVIILQSCSPDEPELAATKPISKAEVDIASAVKQMNFLEDAFGVKALLLKPVDNDPNTNITTLFYADAKGNIKPVIENFEVKDVRVTTNGIYVLTNYGSTAFFVKYDRSWVELKDIGVGTHENNTDGVINNIFVGEDDHGNIAFRNGAILNTQTLQLKKDLETGTVESISGNLWFTITYYRSGGIIDVEVFDYYNPFPTYSIDMWVQQGTRLHGRFNMASFKGTNLAMVPNWHDLNTDKTMFIDMETGTQMLSDSTVSFRNDLLRLDDGSVVGFNQTDPFSTTYKLIKLSAKKNKNGEIMPDQVLKSAVNVIPYSNRYTNKNTYLFGSDQYYIVKEADKVQVFDTSLTHKGEILKGLSNLALSLVDNLVQYSAIGLDNKPVSGIYNLDTNQNTVLDQEHVFTHIQSW